MADFKAIPTLSTRGFVSSVEEAISTVFSYYLLSEYSQTTIFRGKVLSLPYRLKEYSGDERGLCSAIEGDITELFGRSFDSCIASVKSIASESDDKFDITIAATITQSGLDYGLSESLRIENNKLVVNG